MGRASISIAITSSYNAKGVKQAQESVRRLTASLVAMRGGIGSADVVAGSKLAEAAGRLDNLGASMRGVGDALTKGVTVPMTAAAGASIAATAKIDTAWYNVRKTVDATEGEYRRLRQSAVEMSKTSPVSAETILNVEGLGGQLGIAKENLQDFAETVTGLDIATDLDAETAAMQLSQFMNITGAAQDEASNLGSVIVDLGNNFATTESNIMNMATRLASAGVQAGMTDADIMGISTALSAMGMRAEAGGSAMSRVINDINGSVATGSDALRDYAEVAGMSAEEFAESWRRDAAGTFAEFVAKLGEAGEASGSTQVILDRLGISEIRTSDAMRRLAGNSDLVKDAIGRANTAYEENTALSREVDERNNSLESRFGTLRNQAVAAADAFGGPMASALLDLADRYLTPLLQSIEDVGRAFADMPKSQQQTVLGLAAVAAAAGPVLSVGGRLVQGMGKMVDWCGRVRQSQGILKAAMHETDDGILQQLAANKDATAQMGLLQNSYVRAAGGIDSYVGKARAFTDSLSSQVREAELAEVAQDRYRDAMASASAAVEDATASLADARERAAAAMEGEADAVARDHEAKLRSKEANKNLQDAYDRLTEAQKNRISALADETDAEDRRARAVGDAVARQSDAVAKAREAQQRLSDALSRTKDAEQAFVTSSEQAITAANRKKEAEAAYRDAVRKSGEGSDEARDALVRLAEANRNLRTVNQDVSDSFKDLRGAQADAKASMAEVEKAGVGVKEAQAKVAEAMRATGDEARALGDAERAEAEAQRNYDAALREAADATREKREAAEQLQSVYRGNKDAAAQVAAAEGRLAEASDRYRQTVERGVGPIEDLVLTKEEDARVSKKVADANEGIQRKLRDFVGSGKMASTSLDDVGDAARDMGEATGDAFASTQTGAARMGSAVAGAAASMAGKVKAAVSTIGAVFKTMLPMVAIGSVVAGITAIVGSLTEAAERTRDLEGSIASMDGCSVLVTRVGDSFSASARDAEEARRAYRNAGDAIKAATDKIREGNDALVESINGRSIQFQVDVLDVERAGEKLLDLAGTQDWTEATSRRLADTLSEFNSVAGTSWEVVEGTNGVIRDQNGVIVDLAEAIAKATEARRKDLEMQAYEENWKEAYKNRLNAANELAEAQDAYAANQSEENRKRLEEAQQQYDAAVRMEERTKAQMEAQDVAAKYAEKSVRELIAAEEEYADAVGRAGDKGEAFVSMVEGLGVSTERFASLGSENVAKLAQSFDGSFDSLVGGLRDAGVSLEEFGVSASALVASSETFAAAFGSAFKEGVGDLSGTFGSAEEAMAAFGGAVEGLGYRTEDLANLTPEQLKAVAANFDGTATSIVAKLADMGVRLPALGSIAAQGWADGISNGSAAAIEAAVRAKGLTLQELEGMAGDLRGMGNGAMLAFAAAIADGSVEAGMGADQVKAAVEAKMGELGLGRIADDKVAEAVRAVADKSPEFAAAVGLANAAMEQEAQQNKTDQVYLDKANQCAGNVNKAGDIAAAQQQNNAAQEQAAQQNSTPEIVDQKTQEAAENASDPASFEQAGAENAAATASGYQSTDITGPVGDAVRSALADALTGNTDAARETGRALGEGIVEGIGNADVSGAGQKVGEGLAAALGAVDVGAAGTAMGQRVSEAVAATDLAGAGQAVANTLVNGFNACDFAAVGAEAGGRINAGLTASMLVAVGTAALHGAAVAQSFSQAFSTAVAAFDATGAGTALAASASAGIMGADFTTPGVVAGSMAVAGFSLAAASAYAPGLALGSSFARGVAAGAAPAAGHAASAARAASSALGSGAGAARAAGTKTGSQFAAGLRSTSSAAVSSGRSLYLASANALNAGASAARANGSKLGGQFAAGIRSQVPSVRGASGTLASATAAVSNNNRWAYGWGSELGGNFAAGIRSKAASVAAAASSLAAAAAGPLHHSTPDWGPLVNDDLWGAEMVENIAGSMERATPSLARAASRVADTMASADGSGRARAGAEAGAARAQGVQAGNVYNIAIDGRAVQSDPAIRSAVEGLVGAVSRRTSMGR